MISQSLHFLTCKVRQTITILQGLGESQEKKEVGKRARVTGVLPGYGAAQLAPRRCCPSASGLLRILWLGPTLPKPHGLPPLSCCHSHPGKENRAQIAEMEIFGRGVSDCVWFEARQAGKGPPGQQAASWGKEAAMNPAWPGSCFIS